MKLVAFGDSFVCGEIKHLHKKDFRDYYQYSFVKHLTLEENSFSEYENFGIPGLPNESILYELYKYINRNDLKEKFIFISWTGFSRVGLYSLKHDKYFSFSHPIFKDVNTNTDVRNYMNLDFQNEHIILSAIKMLDTVGAKYAMTSSFNNPLRDTKLLKRHSNIWISPDKPNNSLFDIVTKNYDKSDYIDSMFNHTQYKLENNNELLAPCLHPSELGHKVIASVLNKEMKKQSLI